MRLNKNRLRRIIREQMEQLADVVVEPVALDQGPVLDQGAEGPLSENLAPEQEVMVEMEVAARGLEQVAESLNAAAGACAECAQIETSAPILESLAVQVVALQEMVDAQADVLGESAGVPVAVDVPAAIDAVVSSIASE